MTVGNVEIERIVREVVRRLRDVQPPGQPDGCATSPASPNTPSESRSEPEIRQRVISLATLKGRVDGSRCVRIPRGAIVTPSAQDELRDRGIRIEFLTPTIAGESRTETTEVLLATWQTSHCPRAFLDAIGVDGQQVTRLDLNDGPRTLVDAIADRGPGTKRLGILLTDKPSLALCLANRPPCVRAAWGLDSRSVTEAVGSLAANLLVLEPSRHSLPVMINMARSFLDSGGGSCPDAVKQGIAAAGQSNQVNANKE